MKDNIFDFLKRYSAEDISETISMYKLFGGFLFVFALYSAAFWLVPQSEILNELVFGIKVTNALGTFILSTITFLFIILFVGKKNPSNL
ncbi:MAG: hypothetical protein RLZZ507_2665 [Cyanobacteriota bacterium]|jgi:polyferredoxin